MVKTRAQVAREEEEKRNEGRRKTQELIEYKRKKLILGTWIYTVIAILIVVFCILQAFTQNTVKDETMYGNYDHNLSLYEEKGNYSHAFCERVMLTNQDFQDIIRENMLVWANSVPTPEGYRTSQALSVKGTEESFSFLVLIVITNTRMTVLGRIEGDVNVKSVASRLELEHGVSVTDNEKYLVVEHQDGMERKEPLRRLKVEAGREVEVKNEPSPGESDLVHLVIKLPNAKIIKRRFHKSDSLKHLYIFLFSHQDYYKISRYFPKRTPFFA